MRKFTTCCIVGLFVIGVFMEYGPKKVRVYKPEVTKEQLEEGYKEAKIKEIRKDSGRYIKGISYATGDTELICFVRTTVLENILAINISFNNTSKKKEFSMPAKPVTSVIDSDSNKCREISAEEMYKLVMEGIEADDKVKAGDTGGEGLFNRSLRGSSIKRRKDQAAQIEPNSYKPIKIRTIDSAGGNIYYHAESPDSIKVHLKFTGKKLVLSFKE
ncbi:hypothetical protein ACFL5E_02560 [Candidatus Omnitrophota bacterium]